MASKEQVKQQVKFALTQLGSQNAHHEFEHLCRHLTKARICSNIIPATGPVSSAGDQGADFETFCSSVTEVFGTDSFVELTTDKRTVFSCSIQLDKLEDKVKSDVEKSTGRIVKPHRVVYFTTQSVPVGQRHKLQDWATKDKKFELELFDIEALSDMLSEYDTFWIAVEYLHIANELMPPPPNSKKRWYFNILETYRSQEKQLVFNFAEFIEIKLATRAATFDDTLKRNLSFWIELLKKYAEVANSPKLVRMAQYEVAVASLRGLDDGTTFTSFVNSLFSEINQANDTSELENLQVLLFYLIGANSRGVTCVKKDDINTMKQSLKKHLDKYLTDCQSDSSKLTSLEILGLLEMIGDNLELSLEVSKTLEIWWKIIPEIPKTPLYPVERISDRVTQMIEMFGGSDELDNIASELDKFLAERSGNSTAAEQSRDRALIYYRQKNLLKAIDLLHEAKIKWFQHETIVGSLLSIRLIAQWYSEIGLSYAAKYYNMAAFKIAFQSQDEKTRKYLPEITESLAASDYQSGNWINFLEVSNLFITVYLAFNSDPSRNLFLDEPSTRLAVRISLMMMVTDKLKPDYCDEIRKTVSELQCDCFIEAAIKEAQKAWNRVNPDELKRAIERDLTDVPFADTGKVRQIMWLQGGIQFEITFQNTFETAAAGETLASLLQLMFCDISTSGYEMRFVPGRITIDLKVQKYHDKIDAKEIPSNHSSSWSVLWPERDVQSEPEVLAVIFQILMSQSLNSNDDLLKILDERFKAGLSDKLFVVGPYYSLLKYVNNPNKYASLERLKGSPLFLPNAFKRSSHKLLRWDDKLDSLYDRDKSLAAIKSRYEKSHRCIKHTLKKLCTNTSFVNTINKMRSNGWLDWHILCAVASLIINDRLKFIAPTSKADVERMGLQTFDQIHSEEKPNVPMPPVSLFSEDSITMAIKLNLLSTMKVLGLQHKSQTPNFDGIIRFMTAKFRFSSDDVEHDDYFRS